MKLSQTKLAIEAYADALSAADAHSASASMHIIASFLGEHSGAQMSTLVLRGSKVGLNASVGIRDQDDSPDVAGHLDLLANILVSGEAKAGLIKDVVSLAKLLRRLTESETLSAALQELRDAMKPEPIEQRISGYIERLKKETGTLSFDRTFAELAASPLKREHVVAVATSVYGPIKRGASRKGALEYIRKPHDAYMSAKRGIDATGGRSAA